MQSKVIDIRDSISVRDRIEGVRVGRIARIDTEGRIFVDFEDSPYEPVLSRMTESAAKKLSSHNENGFAPVLLLFEDEDPQRPIIIDFVTDRVEGSGRSREVQLKADGTEDVTLNGEALHFNAREEIVLNCGKSSITLTKAGKIIIRGAYLLSRSSGVNRIKGGSVQIN